MSVQLHCWNIHQSGKTFWPPTGKKRKLPIDAVHNTTKTFSHIWHKFSQKDPPYFLSALWTHSNKCHEMWGRGGESVTDSTRHVVRSYCCTSLHTARCRDIRSSWHHYLSKLNDSWIRMHRQDLFLFKEPHVPFLNCIYVSLSYRAWRSAADS